MGLAARALGAQALANLHGKVFSASEVDSPMSNPYPHTVAKGAKTEPRRRPSAPETASTSDHFGVDSVSPLVPTLEQLRDDHGSVIFGWFDDRVFYARFSRAFTVALARQFARRLGCLVGDVDAVRYFCDYSELEAYDVSAFAIAFDAVLAKREQFQLITVLPWRTPPRSNVHALLGTLGCVEFVESAQAFEQRLSAVSPTANRGVMMLISPGDELTERTPNPPPLLPSRLSPNTDPLVYTYVFELDDFEQGRFIATRYAHLSARPRGAWVCVARNDDQALALAREAALSEWAPPTTRRPDEFSVRFLEAPSPSLDR